jgi:hypothetical protein
MSLHSFIGTPHTQKLQGRGSPTPELPSNHSSEHKRVQVFMYSECPLFLCCFDQNYKTCRQNSAKLSNIKFH